MNIFAFADIHFGHMKTRTDVLVRHLGSYFEKHKKILVNSDIIVIAGDVTDRLLEHAGRDSIEVMQWLFNVARFCSKHDITFVILEGTESHDRHQVALFETALRASMLDIDFHYIDTILIRKIRGLDILFVPDNMDDDSDNIYKKVINALEASKMKQVDLAFMHGSFEHQLPIMIPSAHDTKNYIPLVKYCIIVGHNHKHSIYKNIITPGSFDRLAHGEEEPKGAVHVRIVGDEYTPTFIENNLAVPYVSYNVTDDDMEKTISELKKLIRKTKDGYIRLVGESKEIMTQLRDELGSGNMTIKTIGDTTRDEVIDVEFTFKGNNITKETIVELVDEELERKNVDDREGVLTVLRKIR